MISCSLHNKADIGLLYEIDLQTTHDLDSLSAHLEHHVCRIRELCEDRGVLTLTFNPGVDEQVINACLTQHGITEDFPTNEKYVIYYHFT